MKNYQNVRIFMIFARKMSEFYMIIARQIFSRFFFLGGGARHVPPALCLLLLILCFGHVRYRLSWLLVSFNYRIISYRTLITDQRMAVWSSNCPVDCILCRLSWSCISLLLVGANTCSYNTVGSTSR